MMMVQEETRMNARSLSRTPILVAVPVVLVALWAAAGTSKPAQRTRISELHYIEAARRLEVASFEDANPIIAGQIFQAFEAAKLSRVWAERQSNPEHREIIASTLEGLAEHFQAESDALRGR